MENLCAHIHVCKSPHLPYQPYHKLLDVMFVLHFVGFVFVSGIPYVKSTWHQGPNLLVATVLGTSKLKRTHPENQANHLNSWFHPDSLCE